MESSSPPPSPLRSKWHAVAIIRPLLPPPPPPSVRKRKRDGYDDVLVIILKHSKQACGPLFHSYYCESDYDLDRPVMDTSTEYALLGRTIIQVSFSDMKKQLRLGSKKGSKKHEYEDLILKALREMKNPIPEESGVHEMLVQAIFKEIGKRDCVFYRGIMVVGSGILAVHYDKHIDGPGRPASSESIKQIMSKKVRRLRANEKNDSCSICFIPLEEEEEEAEVDDLARLPCGHVYHDGCIRPWLQHKNNTCPMCRYKMPTVVPLSISYTDDDDALA